MFGLLLHNFDQFWAGGRALCGPEAGVVFDFVGNGNLAAKLGTGNDNRFQIGAGVYRGRPSIRPARNQ
jgi:hypothetical protein